MPARCLQHQFRNGNLNQLAYSLFLFIRDVAGGDLVGWIDGRLAEADHGPEDRIGSNGRCHHWSPRRRAWALRQGSQHGFVRPSCRREPHNPRWGEVGGSLIAIDTLVHNFLVRTGILKRARAVTRTGPNATGRLVARRFCRL